MPDGNAVEAWTLSGTHGFEVEVINYGGIVRRIVAPDRTGELADVALGFKNLEEYQREHPYFGAVAGRVAGRISDGKFKLDRREFSLECNDPPNHLHGGSNSIERKLWNAKAVEHPDGFPSLEMTYRSPDGENGYPGNVDLTIRYTVTPSNELIFETRAEADSSTPVSLTQHSYFNLAGEGSALIQDHELQILAEETFAVDDHMTLLDSVGSIRDTPADFTNLKPLREAIPALFKQHGDLYWLGESDVLRQVAKVQHPGSGRRLEVSTDLPCLQFYTSVSLDGTLTGKSGRLYPSFSGFCLECEGYPHAMSPIGFGDILVHPDKPQTSTTIYHFTTNSTGFDR